MRKELENIEQIEDYLMGRFTDDEKANFEAKINSDSKLKREVNFQRNFIEGLERSGLKTDTQNAFRKYKLYKILVRIGIGFIAAGILLGTIYFIQNSSEKSIVYCPCMEYNSGINHENVIMTENGLIECVDTCTIINTDFIIVDSTLEHYPTGAPEITVSDSLIGENPNESGLDEIAPEKVKIVDQHKDVSDIMIKSKVIYSEVEPDYPGGFPALSEFITENVQYPQIAIEERVSGIVYIRFVVNESGEIRDPIVQKGVSKELDAEAIRVIKSMPKWIPATIDGKAVPSYFNLPIDFSFDF